MGFCWRVSHCGLLFGTPIRVTVLPKDSSPLAPSLFILSPILPPHNSLTQSQRSPGPHVCLAANFRPKEGDMVKKVERGSQSVSTSKAVLSKKQKTYFYSSTSEEKISSCQLHGVTVQHPGTSNITIIPTTPSISDRFNTTDVPEPSVVEPCTDCYPEKAKLNSYLLLMTGVRMVFIKTLAFTTIMTARALLLQL